MLSMKIIFLLLSIKICFFVGIGANVTDYESLAEFVMKIRDNSTTVFQYVSIVQAVFCPNQPICNGNGIEPRSQDFSSLPQVLKIGNHYVNIQDIQKTIRVCCLPCSCSESCQETNNCCPSKVVHMNYTIKDDALQAECIAASVKSYRDKNEYHVYHSSYSMIARCPKNESNATLLQYCEHPIVDRPENATPVTSMRTQRTYWNIHCALCNDDVDEVLEWNSTIIFGHDFIFYGNTTFSFNFSEKLDDLYRDIINAFDIIYMPPFPMEDRLCMRKEILVSCQYPEISTDTRHASEMCERFNNPVAYQTKFGKSYYFRNIFCVAFCWEMEFEMNNKNACSNIGSERYPTGSLAAMLDYRQERGVAFPPDSEDECRCNEIRDMYRDTCRPVFCPAGEFLTECQCLQPLKQVSGMPILLTLKIYPNSDQPTTTDTHIGKYNQALINALLDMAKNVTAEIVATFKQETDGGHHYLSIAIVRSNPGCDTKQAIEQYMRYLDNERQLEMRINHATYAINVISRVLTWVEETINGPKLFKAKEIDVSGYKQTRVYFNEKYLQNRLFLAGVYQVLSPLLFCMQVELNDKEYFEKDFRLWVNISSPAFSVPYHYRVAPDRVRVCVNHYFRRLTESAGNVHNGYGYLFYTLISFIAVVVAT